MTKRLFVIFHGRFPSERAAALYAAEHAKSLAAYMPVVLVVPRRLGRGSASARDYYCLPDDVRVVYLPTLDLFYTPLRRIAFPVSYFIFSCAALLYLFFHLRSADAVDTNEALPALLATLASRRVVYEVHDFPERFLWLYRILLRRAWHVLATNTWKQNELAARFKIPAGKVLMERNGVNLEEFAPGSRLEARGALGIVSEARVAVYTGHLYGWKGTDTLAAAARLMPDVDVYVVGGTSADVAEFKKQYGGVGNLHILGHRPHQEMPLWLAAADVLVLPNTAKEEISARYTSPMKLFEYMASGRPIVASRIPSITEVLPEEGSFLVPPDEPDAMAKAIQGACGNLVEAERRASRARVAVLEYSWDKRAERIFKALSQ